MGETQPRNQLLDDLMNNNEIVKASLIKYDVCKENEPCTSETLLEKMKEGTVNPSDLWKQIATDFAKINARENKGNAFLQNLKDRYDNAMSELTKHGSVNKALPQIEENLIEQKNLVKEMSSERIRVNNSEKIRLAVWGIAAVGIFAITIHKLRQ